MKKDNIETSKYSNKIITQCNFSIFDFLVLAKLRAIDKNVVITPYAAYHRLDPSKIKIKEPNHLFDIDPSNRRSNKRTFVDKDAPVASTQEPTTTITTVSNFISIFTKFLFSFYFSQWILVLI